ncbi:MAG TPA: thioredoxin family protein [Isosphaeraceae bacterium]
MPILIALVLLATDPWHLEFDDGQAAARREGKDLLIDFGGTDWCLPCRWLKERVLSKPEFIDRAAKEFALVDIDLPLRTPIAADRKARYQKLQERYGIISFPTVVLATSDGRPYARTTYREAIATPQAYWDHLPPHRGRGARLREALARADMLKGKDRARAIVDGLAEVDAGFVPLFYADRVAEVRALDPADETGYLAFLDARKALDDFYAGKDTHRAAMDVAEVDALIARAKPRGELLQEALAIRAAAQVLAGRDREALDTFDELLAAQASRTRFDRGDFVPLDDASIALVRRRIAAARADDGSGLALYFNLHRILEFDLPNSYELSCGGPLRPNFRVQEPVGDRYGRALLKATEGLDGEARAKALAKGLEGTFFVGRGPIGEVLQLIVKLVGKEGAGKLLPGEFYPRIIN